MSGRKVRLLAIVFACLLTISVLAPIGAAMDGAQSDEKEELSQTPAAVDDDLKSAGGTTEVIVRLADAPATAAAGETRETQLKRHSEQVRQPVITYAEQTDGVEVINSFWITPSVFAEVDTNQVDLAELARVEGVDRLQKNFEMTPHGEASESDDAGTVSAVDVDGTAEDSTYGLDQINATETWDAYDTQGEGTSVAVLDTGVDPDHPDIDITDENFQEFDEDGNEVDSTPHDSGEHGTHVSGTVSGGDASGEHIGVAPNVELMHGLVIPDGSGSFTQIIAGMEWAVEEDADVVSMSLGAEGYYPQMIEPVQNAEDAGTIVVSSAGNDGVETSGSPGNVHEALAIGASDANANIADFSSGEEIDTADAWGSNAPPDWPGSYVVPDVSAPGVNVKSSVPGGGYDDSFSGTSMAAPHVSGTIALMLSASEDDPTAETITNALEETAWKPDGESTEQDDRYGHGIVDAKAATDRVAADSGLEGVVANEDGEPIEGATVELDGVPRSTNASGAFRHRIAPGEYDVTVDAFGYESVETTVAVEEDDFTEENFELASALDARVAADQPEAIESGESFETTLEVMSLESTTIEAGGNYEGTLSLEVDGESAEFGEPIAFNETYSGDLTVTVHANEGTMENVELTHVLEGTGHEIELSTGPTYVVDEHTDVAVVDTPDGTYGSQVQTLLEQYAHPRFAFESVGTDDVMDTVDDEEYDVYVVQNLGEDEELISTFIDETESAQIGVVLLDQYGDAGSGPSASNAISQLSEKTGDPSNTGYGSTAIVSGAPDVEYTAQTDHPIFDGVASDGEEVAIATPDPVEMNFAYFGGFHSYFEGYDGIYDSRELASIQLSNSYEPSGTGLAADPFSRTVLASSLGLSSLVDESMINEDGGQILANSVEYVTDSHPIVPTENQAAKIEPGDSVEVTFSAEQLEQVKVDVAERSTYDENDLSLYIDDSINAFGEWRAYDPPRDDEFDVRVDVHEDAGAGTLSLDHTFIAGEDDETIELSTGPTGVYEGETLEVDASGDGDVETLSAAVDYIEDGGEIVVEDGTYYEDDTDYDGSVSTAVVVDNPGTTIRAAEGADPTVLYDDYVLTGDVISVQADDVHIEGLTVNVQDESAHESVYHGVGVRQGTSGFSAEDLEVGGTIGVLLGEGISDIRVEDVVGYGTYTLVGTEQVGGPANDVWIENVSIGNGDSFMYDGIRIENSDNVTITESNLTDVPSDTPGIYAGDSGNLTITNNEVNGIQGADAIHVSAMQGEAVVKNNTVDTVSGETGYPGRSAAGIYADSATPRELTVVDNHVTNASSGLTIGNGPVATVEHNTVSAETGVSLTAGYGDFDPSTVESVTYNDLSGSDVPFYADSNVTDSGSDDEPAGVDARLNYVGDRTADESIATVGGEQGDIVYQPFLTEAPNQLEEDPAETTAIGVDLELEAGEMYGVGVPGPSETSVDDMFDEDFEGTAYSFDADTQSWDTLSGDDTVDALNATVVAAETDTRLTLDFQSPDGVPPTPGAYRMQEGWNFVASPAYTDAEDAYGVGSFEPGQLTSTFDAPAGQFGPDGDVDGTYIFGSGDAPTVSAFEGYFVYSEDEGTMPARFVADPTMDDLYGHLDVDDQFADGESEDASVQAVLANADEIDREIAVERLSKVVYREFESSIATADHPRTALDETAASIAEDADGDHRDLVADATADALERILAHEFGDGSTTDRMGDGASVRSVS